MEQLVVAAHPHVRSRENTQTIMFDVVIALIPCIVAGVYFFGYRTVALLAVAVLSSILFEWLWCKALRQKSSVWDLSALVSAIILTMNLSPTVPLWIPVVGSFFMIVIVKMCFGGLGQNFVNPAAAARVFLAASFPMIMNKFIAPHVPLSLLSPDVVTSATPLAIAKLGAEELPSYITMYLGYIGGCIGETSTLAIIIGALYLCWRKVIRLEAPLAYLGTVALLTLVLGKDPIFHLLAGGLMFGAVFMATDYTTSPLTRKGQLIFGMGLGIFTVLIRIFGGADEGVCMSILMMNVLVPLIDKIRRKRFGLGGGRSAKL